MNLPIDPIDRAKAMQEQNPEINRLTNPQMDQLLGHQFPVLDHGFIRVVDYLGDDRAIVQAARISYGQGTKTVQDDEALVRYLMRMKHTSPFEQCEIKLHVKVPMDAHRQFVRHRTACLAEGTELYFDLPARIKKGKLGCYPLKVEDVWARFQPTSNRQGVDRQRNPFFKRDRVKRMLLRQVNEDTMGFQHTHVVDVWKSGVKPVFRYCLADGKTIEATADHKFLFSDGWGTFGQVAGLTEQGGIASMRQGDYFMYVNGSHVAVPAMYQDKRWLDEQYKVRKIKIDDIAEASGVSYHTIRKWLRIHGIQQPKGGRSKTPWNKGREYTLGARVPSKTFLDANRKARAGEASNFWRGGMASERASIGRWTTQVAPKVHARNGWTCQLCHNRANELHCHHIVPVWANIALAREESNLTTLCGDCHRDIAGRELEFVERLGGEPVVTPWVKRPRVAWNKLTVAKLVRVESVVFVGNRETYDVEVEAPYHNFVANGVVTHNSLNEYSTRYSEAIDERQATEPWQWRTQAQGNKQGSGHYLDRKVGEDLSMGEKQLHDHATQEYRRRLDLGVAREQARKDLPLSTYTELYWKIDLHNLLHFLELRLDPLAQLEIRQYAVVIEGIVAQWVPWTYRAFHDYRVQAMGLSRPEVLLFREMTMRLVTDLSRGTHDTHDLLGDVDALHRLAANHGMSKRETQEAAGKITHLLCLEPQGDEPRP